MRKTQNINSDTTRVEELKLYTKNIKFYLDKLRQLCRGKEKIFFFTEIQFYIKKIEEIICKEE